MYRLIWNRRPRPLLLGRCALYISIRRLLESLKSLPHHVRLQNRPSNHHTMYLLTDLAATSKLQYRMLRLDNRCGRPVSGRHPQFCKQRTEQENEAATREGRSYLLGVLCEHLHYVFFKDFGQQMRDFVLRYYELFCCAETLQRRCILHSASKQMSARYICLPDFSRTIPGQRKARTGAGQFSKDAVSGEAT